MTVEVIIIAQGLKKEITIIIEIIIKIIIVIYIYGNNYIKNWRIFIIIYYSNHFTYLNYNLLSFCSIFYHAASKSISLGLSLQPYYVSLFLLDWDEVVLVAMVPLHIATSKVQWVTNKIVKIFCKEYLRHQLSFEGCPLVWTFLPWVPDFEILVGR